MSLLNRSLGMGRRLAESRMTETIVAVKFRDGTDPETGDPTRVIVTEKYTGSARIKYPSLGVTERDQPSQVVSVQQPYLSIPTGSSALADGDEVHVSASTADSSLVGRVYRVEGAPQSGQTTSHRYPLTQLS